MKERQATEVIVRYADRFAAMGSDERLSIMRQPLSAHSKGMIVCDIRADLDTPNSSLSHYFEKLRNEGPAAAGRNGTLLRDSANTEALREVVEFRLRGMLYSKQSNRTRDYIPDPQIVHRLQI